MRKYLYYGLALLSITSFSACGGGSDDSSSSVTVSGKAIDGYLSGATVKVGNKTTTTDANGNWKITLDSIANNTIVTVTGGTDISTNTPFEGNLSAVIEDGKTNVNISPLTTLVAKVVEGNGVDINDAKNQIAQSLGIEVDEIDVDPIALLNENQTKANNILTKIIQIQKSVEVFDDIPEDDKNITDPMLVIAQSLHNGVDLNNSLSELEKHITDDSVKQVFVATKNELLSTVIDDSDDYHTIATQIEEHTNSIETHIKHNDLALALAEADSNITKQVLDYNGSSDVNLTISLDNGTYTIIAEYSGNNPNNQIAFGTINDSDITTINDRTSSNGVAKATITNSSTAKKTYTIPFRVYDGTSATLKAAPISVIITKDGFNELKNFDLILENNNTAFMYSEQDTHIWSFKTNSDQNGTYKLNITTDYNNYENPLRYFRIELTDGSGKDVYTNNGVSDGEISNATISLDANTTYTLRIYNSGGNIPASPSDSLGYYTINISK